MSGSPYPGPGGTVKFIKTAFGTGVFAASVNVLLVLSYVAIMSVYADALAAYTLSYIPETMRPMASHVIASAALVLRGLVNVAGASLMERLEGLFNIGKLAIVGLFIVGGFTVGKIAWFRLEPASWAAPSAIVSSGMLGFLAYEGFGMWIGLICVALIQDAAVTIVFLALLTLVVAIVLVSLLRTERRGKLCSVDRSAATFACRTGAYAPNLVAFLPDFRSRKS